MNDDKLKEGIEKLKVDADELLAEPQVKNATDGVFAQTKEWAISVTDLIKAYRQSEKELSWFAKQNCGLIVENKELSEANAKLLAVLTTDEVDRTTLVETLNAARKIILHLEPELYFETTEELYVWAEKLEEHKGE